MKVWCEPRESPSRPHRLMAVTVCFGYFGHDREEAQKIANKIGGEVKRKTDPDGNWDYIVTKELTL